MKKYFLFLLFFPLTVIADHETEFSYHYQFGNLVGGSSSSPAGACASFAPDFGAFQGQQTPSACGTPFRIYTRFEVLNESQLADGSLTAQCRVIGENTRVINSNGVLSCPSAGTERVLLTTQSITTVITSEHDEEDDQMCEQTIGLATVLSGSGSSPPSTACLSSCEYDLGSFDAIGDPNNPQADDFWIGDFVGNGNQCTVGSNTELFENLGPPLPEENLPPDDPDIPDDSEEGSNNNNDSSPDSGTPDGGTDTGGSGAGGGDDSGSSGGTGTGDSSSDNDNTTGDNAGDSGGDSDSGGSNSGGVGDTSGGGGEGDEVTEAFVSGGEQCAVQPTCTGDTLLCAIHLQQWRTRCEANELPSDSEIVNSAGLDEFGIEALESDTIDLPTRFDSSGFLTARQCPADNSISLFGQTHAFSYVFLCDFAELLSFFIVLVGTFHATRIIISD